MSSSDKSFKCSTPCTTPCTTPCITECASKSTRLTGMVKWFNNKSGFGFITVSGSGEFGGKDIFAHYSSIRVSNSQYKYLVQGEYVDFVLVKSENEKHEYHATDITGVQGGAIMCETRRVAMAQESQTGQSSRSDKSGQPVKSDRQYKTRPSSDEPRSRAPRPTQSTSTDGFSIPKKRGPPRKLNAEAVLNA